MERLEISDLVVAFDGATSARLPVRRDDVVRELANAGDRRGAAIARRLPTGPGGFLDEAQIDRLLVRVHTELQRLSEEFQQGRRVEQLLGPLVRSLPPGPGGRRAIVDVGCGLGYLVRWLALRSSLGPSVDLVGCDYNHALIAAARRLAADESLACTFIAANAFSLDRPSAVFVSTGVVHHFRGSDLDAFFAAQDAAGAAAFVHYDTAPTSLAPLGAWLFHWARMREPLSRHDGMQSVRRAHTDDELVDAVRRGAPGMVPVLLDGVRARHPLLNVLRPVIGIRPEHLDGFLRVLGPLAPRAEVRR